MYQIDLEVLSLAQAEHRYYSEFPLRHALDNLPIDALAASSFASITLRHSRDFVSQRNTLFIFLRETLLSEVPALARSDFFEYNDHSPDRLKNWTYLEARGEHVRVRVYAQSLGHFIDLDDDQPAFDVVYVCGPLAFVSTHKLSAEQADEMMCSLQGCGIGAGVNYRPYALWSDEVLAAAAQRRHVPRHGLITAHPYEPGTDWRKKLGFPSYS